jgi:hypothetical protein
MSTRTRRWRKRSPGHLWPRPIAGRSPWTTGSRHGKRPGKPRPGGQHSTGPTTTARQRRRLTVVPAYALACLLRSSPSIR